MLFVIAIWNRHHILKYILNYLSTYDLPFTIGFLLIYSKPEDYNVVIQDNIHYVYSPNEPLGSKWLTGMLYSSIFDCKCITICGSDDIISKSFLKKSYHYIVNLNKTICYTNSWAVYDKTANKLYYQSYTDKKNVGCG